MKTKLIAATALVVSSFSPAFITPAFAQVTPEVQAELDAFCNALVPPNDDNPPFIVTAINAVEGDTVGAGETVIGVVDGSEHRNGGSPNIFGTLVVEISGGFTTYTVDCQVFNPNSGGFPPGLQRTGETALVANTNTVISESNGVICISPGRNPGTWRNQNGYTGECSTAVFNALDGRPIPIPSNSLPDA